MPIWKALNQYLSSTYLEDDNFLFLSKKGVNKPITIQTVNALVKKWTKSINLEGNYGSHSLRKTWGYHQRIKYSVSFEVIAKRFNHSNPRVTIRYLGIEDKEVHKILMNEIGGNNL